VSTNGRLIDPDVLAEGRRLGETLAQEGIAVRLLGGLAVRVIAGEGFHPAFTREIRDIDFATRQQDARRLGQVLSDQGYTPNKTFNAMHGARRLLFYDEANARQVDVFVGTFEMCHTLPLDERLGVAPLTLPGADLLMTKLQIVKLNEKDRTDIYALLLALEVSDTDDGGGMINRDWIARLCARDWGLYRTFQLNIGRLQEHIGSVPVDGPEREVIAERLSAIEQAIEDAPKSSKWKLRARVGDRMRWYEDPEEVERGGY
jgi:hypothetical protein